MNKNEFPLDAALVATGSKATYSGAGITIGGYLLSSEFAVAFGMLIGVIGLAKAFGRQVIAEGVETAAHGERLLALGCELAQGYGIARPMAPADLPAWVAAWSEKPAWLA